MSITVYRKYKESIDDFILRFKRKCKRENLMLDIEKNRYFTKKSAKKRKKQLNAKHRQQKLNKENAN